MKICIACSAGGHLTEILFLKKVYDKHDHFYVTFRRPNSLSLSKNEEIHFIEDPERNPIKLIKNFFQSLKIILKKKPDVIISTGAGVAVPICYFGKFFGSKIVFIESFCRITSPSISGKILYPISDLFIVQWEKMKIFYPKSVYGGLLV